MTEKDWIRALAKDPREVLAPFHDWLLEREDGAGAAFCRWLIKRQKRLGRNKPLGPRTYLYYVKYRYFFMWEVGVSSYWDGRGLPSGLPISVFDSLPSYQYKSRFSAWKAAFLAWRRAWARGKLKRYALKS